MSGGDSKQHGPLSAVLGLEGRAGYVSNQPQLDHFQQPVLSAVIFCLKSCRDKRAKVIDYSLQCPSSCPKCTGSCLTQLCLQPLAGLPLHRTLITKLGKMKGTLKVPASVPKLLSENKACPNTFLWHVPAGISTGNTSDSYQTSQLLDSQL